MIGQLSKKALEPIIAWLSEKRPTEDIPLCHFAKIRQSIEPCDVLLIEGRSRSAEVIKLITQSPWSHAALYIGRIADIENIRLREQIKKHYDGSEYDQLLAESELGIGTMVRPIDVYEQEHIRICRPRNLSEDDKSNVIRFAISCMGYEYNIRQILDLARFLFPWKIMPRRFRSTLFTKNIGDATKTVCSTMVAQSFNFVNFPILPLIKCDDDYQLKLYRKNPKFCVPRDFDYSPYFEIIKYPFIDYLDANMSYRELPWQGEFDQEYHDSLAEIEANDEKLNQLFEKKNRRSDDKKQDEKKEGSKPSLH